MSARRSSVVTLVVAFCDLATGRSVCAADGLLEVSGNGGYSLPVGKPDGYFVFVDETIGQLSVRSKVFEDFDLVLADRNLAVIRLGLVRRQTQRVLAQGVNKAGYELGIGEGEAAWVGFGGAGLGYGLLGDVREGDTVVALDKDDFIDLTWLHLAAESQSPAAAVLRSAQDDKNAEGAGVLALGGSVGRGRYALCAPASCVFAARETEFFPLMLVVGGASGTLLLPVPETAVCLYVLREGAAAELERVGLSAYGQGFEQGQLL
jgi:hypothetical protein